MSTALITSTSFVGMDIAFTRTPTWETRIQENVSGKETRVTYRTIPRYTWEINFNFLRNSSAYSPGGLGVGSSEYSAFVDFYNNRSGAFDSWQWQDPEDNTGVTETLLFVSAGVYQLQRNVGSGTFMDPIYAPNDSFQVWIAGSSASTVGITPNYWGSSSPGLITLTTATPSSGTAVFGSFTFYWPVRFDVDKFGLERMMNNLWMLKKVSFTSII